MTDKPQTLYIVTYNTGNTYAFTSAEQAVKEVAETGATMTCAHVDAAAHLVTFDKKQEVSSLIRMIGASNRIEGADRAQGLDVTEQKERRWALEHELASILGIII